MPIKRDNKADIGGRNKTGIGERDKVDIGGLDNKMVTRSQNNKASIRKQDNK